MDRISQLPDALLLEILSLLPARDVVATMVLSKRWQFLWSLVPGLIYDDSYQDIEYEQFSLFVHRYLLLHEAPVLENLHFKLSQKSVNMVDIEVWFRAVVKRCVHDLNIEIDSIIDPPILPRCLYTECRKLVTLKLENVILVDFSYSVSFSSLKNLSLLSVEYPGDEFVNSLLSNCPVLENLTVERCPNENVKVFSVRVPSLKRLVLYTPEKNDNDDGEDGFVIDAPCLEYLDIIDDTDVLWVIENELPHIVEANVDAFNSHHHGKILSSITSVKRLFLCLLTSEDVYPVGTVFHHLVDLTFCTCSLQLLNLLMRVLGDSPNLRALKLGQYHDHLCPCWIKPNSVPKCLKSSLETLKWEDYEGTEEEKQLFGFILRNGSCLEKVKISFKSTDRDKKLEMVKELSLSFRLSPKCQLAFD